MENLITSENLESLKQNVESILSDVPANYLLGAGAAAWIISSGLKSFGKENAASFIEKWSLPLLTVGLYQKLAETNENKEGIATEYSSQ